MRVVEGVFTTVSIEKVYMQFFEALWKIMYGVESNLRTVCYFYQLAEIVEF